MEALVSDLPSMIPGAGMDIARNLNAYLSPTPVCRFYLDEAALFHDHREFAWLHDTTLRGWETCTSEMLTFALAIRLPVDFFYHHVFAYWEFCLDIEQFLRLPSEAAT